MSALSSTKHEAIAALRRGEAVIFPTETVYGLGVSVEAAASPDVLYDLKERDRGKPISWLVGGVDDLDRYGAHAPDLARRLARAYWPGPLTLDRGPQACAARSSFPPRRCTAWACPSRRRRAPTCSTT